MLLGALRISGKNKYFIISVKLKDRCQILIATIRMLRYMAMCRIIYDVSSITPLVIHPFVSTLQCIV